MQAAECQPKRGADRERRRQIALSTPCIWDAAHNCRNQAFTLAIRSMSNGDVSTTIHHRTTLAPECKLFHIDTNRDRGDNGSHLLGSKRKFRLEPATGRCVPSFLGSQAITDVFCI